MTRMMIAPEHKKFFQINGFISFEELVSSREMKELFNQIYQQRSELPGLILDNLFRSIPTILTLAGKLGPIAASLIDRKPLYLMYDCLLEDIEKIPQIQDRELGLLLSLTGKGLFFTDRSHLYNEKEKCYFLLVFTANYVNNPIVFK